MIYWEINRLDKKFGYSQRGGVRNDNQKSFQKGCNDLQMQELLLGKPLKGRQLKLPAFFCAVYPNLFMNVRRDRGPSLILAALRGFCLFFSMDIVSADLPAGRQVGKRNRSGPLSRLVPEPYV
jgi:hypothetical protein